MGCGMRPRIGVLALQGAFREHCRAVARCGAEAVEVRRPLGEGPYGGLDLLEGLILPGGESTVMGKLLEDWDLLEPVRRCIQGGLPVYGTCAGLILLCSRIEDADGRPSEQARLGALNATVRRNAFGRQTDSFECELDVREACSPGHPLRAVFIRAPVLIETGPDVRVLARVPFGTAGASGTTEARPLPVAVRQGKVLATSFHPELTGDLRMHRYFLDMAAAWRAARES